MKILSVSIPDNDLKIINQFIEIRLYANVTDCIRIALRDYLWDEVQKIK